VISAIYECLKLKISRAPFAALKISERKNKKDENRSA
jgi:hypothetical protein